MKAPATHIGWQLTESRTLPRARFRSSADVAHIYTFTGKAAVGARARRVRVQVCGYVCYLKNPDGSQRLTRDRYFSIEDALLAASKRKGLL